MKKIVFLSLISVLVLSLIGCSGNSTTPTVENSSEKTTPTVEKNNSSDSTVEKKLEEWKEKDASYLGTDEFGKDLDEISDELYEMAEDSGGYTSREESIWQYCVNRWEYYDELEGGYSGDKHTEDVFRDAGNKFNITANEAEIIWSKVDGAKLGL